MRQHITVVALLFAAVLVMNLAACGKEDADSGSQSYVTAVTYRENTSVDGASFNSEGSDENAIVVEDGDISLKNITVKRSSQNSTGGDNASFYGVGSAILAKGGTTVIQNADISTDSKGGTGVFAYGDGVVKIGDSTIFTSQDTSGAVHVAGGGTLYADNVTATTEGESSAAVRSDRGGGLMVIKGGSYTSKGIGSPAVYCTATIAVKDAGLTANGSEAVCIEGLNSLYLYDCDLSGNMGDSEQNDCTWNIILYQSMSGDSAMGNSTFQMTGGTLTAENGGMFYTTNTESTFVLNDVNVICAEDSEFFLRCTGNNNQRGWGNAGENGADCAFTAIKQDMEGDIVWDSISKLDFFMTDGSVLRGAFTQDESCAGSGGDGYANLCIDTGSRWIVTGDSVLTALYNAGTVTDAEGKTATVKGTDGTVYVSGDSDYTVTVSLYNTSADLSQAGTVTAFEEAQVNNGSQDDGMPSGEPKDGQEPPEKPDGEPKDGQEPPEKPDGEPKDGQEPPEKPDGEPKDGQGPPEKPSSEPKDGQEPSEKQGGSVSVEPAASSGEETFYAGWSDISDGVLDEEFFFEELNIDVLTAVATELQGLVDEEVREEKENPEIVFTEGYSRIFSKQQYLNVIAMGEKAEMPLYFILYMSENDGMYEHICATALSELTGLTFINESGDYSDWSSGKEYLELFNEYISNNNGK